MKIRAALFLSIQLAFVAAGAYAAPPAQSSPPASQAISPVYVVAPNDQPAQGVAIDTPKQAPTVAAPSVPTKPIEVWSGPVPLAGGLWLLVASMPVLAILYFAYQLLLFIKARRRKLSHPAKPE